MPTLVTDTKWLQDCLDIFTKLCFQPRHRLPTVRLEPGPFYYLEAWHQNWFGRCSQAKAGSINLARALLIPIFLELNKCVRRTSLFLPIYEIDWTRLSQALKGFTEEREWACYVLASGVNSEDDIRFDSRFSFDSNVGEVRVNTIVCRAKKLWEIQPHHPKRTTHYVSFV
jgi:hypothetical protein